MSVIVAPQPQAAEIGLEVLRRGGNAVDAAVTCAFAQGVLDPQMCGIGGCGVMLVHDRHGEDVLLEFYSTAGSLVRGGMRSEEGRVGEGGVSRWAGRVGR